ncbi:MAG: hypothetical protein JNM00_16085 [Flavobacteriales bacterium]|nr:hypothetical protein [Flavobacteriales bacterium]
MAQQTEPSAKVKAAFTGEQISAMSDNELQFLNFVADNACIIEYNPEKAAGLPDACTTFANISADADAHTMNLLLTGIQLSADQHQYYRLGDTGKTLFVYSKSRLQVMFQRDLATRKANNK